MKKNLVLAILLLVIVAGSFWAYSLFEEEKREMSTEPLSDFQIKDTASVYKIVITEKDHGSITLNRGTSDKNWYIDDTKEIAQPYNVNLILETAFQIQIKQNVSEELKETALTQLSIRHKKVEYYFDGEDKPRKTWYVGNGTTNHMGTYMLLELYDKSSGKSLRSPDPFIMHKPGVYGTLDTRFFANKKDWIYPGVFNYNIKDIASIKVVNNEDANESFSVKIQDNGKVNLLDKTETKVNVFDTSEVQHYVTHYKDLFYESFASELDQNQSDSILKVNPHFVFEVTEKNGNKKTVRLWKIKKNQDGIGLNEIQFDTGRAYISINGSKDLVKVQFFTWDVLFKPLSYFRPKQASPFQY